MQIIGFSPYRLVPNVILKFAFEGASSGLQEYLKEELLMLASPMWSVSSLITICVTISNLFIAKLMSQSIKIF